MSTVIVAAVEVIALLLAAPLFEGLMRNLVRARLHSRQGPPILQPYYDLFKLLIKEDVQPAPGRSYFLPAVACLATVLTAALLIPITGDGVLSHHGDAILFIYLLTLSAVTMVLAGAMSASPYSYLGLGREVMMILSVEPVLILGFVTAALKVGSFDLTQMMNWQIAHGPSVSMIIAAVAIFVSIQAQIGKLPFDVPEAEQELMGGPLTELSGPKLALFEWALWAKQLVLVAVLVQVFVPWPWLAVGAAGIGVAAWIIQALIVAAKIMLVVILVAVIDVVNPRLRIDQTIVYYLSIVFLAAVGVAFALIGA
ncbi:MAG: NADH-quinone oxidoreductase subunit H [Armatimonadota bacterium]